MITCDELINRTHKLSVVGLGYVGLPVAAAFSEKLSVIGFDINAEKIDQYRHGIDPTREIGNEAVAECSVFFTCDPKRLREVAFHIVAVPTPVNEDNTPDLSPLVSACKLLGAELAPGSVVVFESTVYPCVTEDTCVPILERESRLVCGRDFFVGYSPERINPGDMKHRLNNIVKIVSGMDDATLGVIADVYSLVVDAGVYRAPSIKVAEAAKVIENSQRDINIAFMNELSMIFNRMGIDTLEVLKAAGTKWNFLNFKPGLVGGHCIGVDPYYLTYRAQQFGYISQIILSGRRINDAMGKYVVENVIKMLIKASRQVKGARVALLGFTFKENCPDTRNTRVIDIVHELREYGIEPLICDPVADADEAERHYGVKFTELPVIKDMDALIIAVGHKEFCGLDITPMLSERGIIADLKGVVERPRGDYAYWRL